MVIDFKEKCQKGRLTFPVTKERKLQAMNKEELGQKAKDALAVAGDMAKQMLCSAGRSLMR